MVASNCVLLNPRMVPLMLPLITGPSFCCYMSAKSRQTADQHAILSLALMTPSFFVVPLFMCQTRKRQDAALFDT